MEDVLKKISQLKNTFITGSSRTGKDLLASLAVENLKQQQPELTVYVIELNDDLKESHYNSCGDIVRRLDISKIINDPKLTDLFNWLQGCFEEFSQIAGKKLLIISEVNYIFSNLIQDKDCINWIWERIISYLTIEKSTNSYLWLIGQDLGFLDIKIPAAILSRIRFVLIVSGNNLAIYDNLCQTSLIPKNKQLSKEKIKAIASSSLVNSSLYCDGQWSPMPMLVAPSALLKKVSL